jgi:hypothetical protein
MQGHGWQAVKRVTVPHGGNIAVALPPSRPVLDKLTIWASSGARPLTNMTFQTRVNGKNLGGSVSIVGAVAADVVFAMAGASFDQVLVPYSKNDVSLNAAQPALDPLEMDVLVSNAGASDADVTIYFVATGRE